MMKGRPGSLADRKTEEMLCYFFPSDVLTVTSRRIARLAAAEDAQEDDKRNEDLPIMRGIMTGNRKQNGDALKPAVDRQPEFRQIYADNVHGIYAYVAWRVGHRQTAEDVTSTVFERAWSSFGTYDASKGSAATWLFTIARNAVSDHFRRASRAQAFPLEEWISADAGDADPESEFLTRERRLRLGGAIAGLEARDKEILSLKFGGGLTNREIAGLLEISESNVGTILYRCLEKIKTRLEGVMEND
jgi:RNA polymerase sigma-70 factor (ECF subfamily)